MYKRIHKIHHEHKITTSIAAIYAHPLEYLIGNAIPATLGPFMLGRRMHMSSYFAWGIWRIAEAVQGHSGYDFTWNPYRFIHLTSDGKEHAFHHSENIGNYSGSIWDLIFGTNLGSKKLADFKTE
jgi:sterol desaturase/sphingolipid hydroxylase (fatty acid hydroxylase superfamily)